MGSPEHLVIAGGGTGGHLFPGVAVAEAFLELCPEGKVTFVGTERGIEARVIPELGFPLELVEVSALKGGGLMRKMKSAAGLPMSGLRARKLLRRLEPSAVVSVGGYAAGPVTLMASWMGIPTALMEQNSTPGMTNRWLGKSVDRGYLTFEDSARYFDKLDARVVGNPVRKDLLAMADGFSYEAPGKDGPFRILIIGGSGGAGSFNEHLPGLFQSMGELAGRLHVRHQAGRDRADDVRPRYEGFTGSAVVEEFIDDMVAAYRWCDLLICRAGASTMAEVLNLGLPAIYVPFPHAADDHQRANALSVVEAGAGVMIDDSELESDRARALLRGFMANPEALSNLARRARELGRPQAARDIAEDLVSMIRDS